MRPSVTQVLLFASTSFAHQPFWKHDLQPRDIVNVGPLGICPAVGTTTIELQPVYYHEYFPYTALIYPFRNGVPFTVSNAATDVEISSRLTRTIYPGSATPQTITASSSSQSLVTTRSSNPPNLVTTTAASDVSGSSTSSSPAISNNNLFIGEGLPGGTVTDLPDSQFIFLAVSNFGSPTPTPTGPLRARQVQHARRQAASPDISPLTLVNLAQPTDSVVGGLSQDDCDDSSPLILREGSLLQFDHRVNKHSGSTTAELGFLTQFSSDQINITFVLVDGVLQWNTPDVGSAAFWVCDSLFYAGFLDAPFAETCVQIEVGAVAGQACRDRVVLTAQVNPTFTAPIPTSPPTPPVTAQTLSTSVVSTSNLASTSPSGITASTSTTAVAAASTSNSPSASSLSTSFNTISSSALSNAESNTESNALSTIIGPLSTTSITPASTASGGSSNIDIFSSNSRSTQSTSIESFSTSMTTTASTASSGIDTSSTSASSTPSQTPKTLKPCDGVSTLCTNTTTDQCFCRASTSGQSFCANLLSNSGSGTGGMCSSDDQCPQGTFCDLISSFCAEGSDCDTETVTTSSSAESSSTESSSMESSSTESSSTESSSTESSSTEASSTESSSTESSSTESSSTESLSTTITTPASTASSSISSDTSTASSSTTPQMMNSLVPCDPPNTNCNGPCLCLLDSNAMQNYCGDLDTALGIPCFTTDQCPQGSFCEIVSATCVRSSGCTLNGP